MFENDQSAVEQLLNSSDSFRHLYDKHSNLNARVDEITAGDEPMDQLELETLKKEKLQLADQMQTMLHDFHTRH